MKKYIILALIIIMIILLIPFLHQDLPSGKCYFSILDAISEDLAENQFNTFYFIIHLL